MDFFRLLALAIRRAPAPELRIRLASEVGVPVPAEPGDEEALAADHESLFGFNVPPFASLFLEEKAMLGGAVTARAASFRMEANLPPATVESADHASSELELLSALQRDSARAHLLCLYLNRHFYAWYPAFARAVAAEGNVLYAAAVGQALDRILAQPGADMGCENDEPVGLPESENILERADTGVRDIARFLATPVRCGLFLSRSAIVRLGRGGRYPTGFRDRAGMLDTLLRSAALYDGLHAVAAGIEREIGETRAAWETVARRGPDAAGFWASEWLARLERTRAVLGDIMAAVREDGSREG